MATSFTRTSPGFETPGGVHNATPPRIVFGAGSFAQLRGEVERLGRKRVLVISTPGRRAVAEIASESLGELSAGVHAEAISQVPIELVRDGREIAARLEADCLVTVGGGAATGLGKGIALQAALPIVAVPTTYSGSEMTGFCGITIQGVKRMHASLNMLASTVIYDAELSLSLPPTVTASSALNALAHSIDSIYLKTISPLLRPAASEAAAVVVRNLPEVLARPTDVDARQRLFYGAYLAGASLTGGFSIQHGVAHALGGTFGVEHGLAHAIVLPHVTALLEDRVGEKLSPIAAALETDNLACTIYDLLVASGIPTSLEEVGLHEDQLDRVAQVVLETSDDGDDAGIQWSRADIDRILFNAFVGARPGGGM